VSIALGVVCRSDLIYLCVSIDGQVQATPDRIEAPAMLETEERLDAILADLDRLLVQVQPGGARLLLPELTYEGRYSRIAPRVALETLVRVACLRRDVQLELLQRRTARTRLDLAQTGSFEDHLTTAAIGEPVGKYWNAGRVLAAAAALADG
jgi:hypothetical protein